MRLEKRAAKMCQKLKPPRVIRHATAIVSRAAMATPATAVAAAGAAGVRVVEAMTGRETVVLIVGLTDVLIVVHEVAPVAAARAILTPHATTLKLGSLRGDAAKSAMGVRWVGISGACMCATISPKLLSLKGAASSSTT